MEVVRKADERYHHGALREALLRAVEAIIAEGGLEGLTLRGCARRAGVSSGAPAHHFGDKTGLLTEFAVEGFARLVALIDRERARAPAGDPREQLVAVGLGYVACAAEHPSHFRVMFRPELLRADDPRLHRGEAHGRLLEALRALDAARGGVAGEPAADRALLAWSVAHGLASLWAERTLAAARRADASPEAARLLAEAVLRRSLDGLAASP